MFNKQSWLTIYIPIACVVVLPVLTLLQPGTPNWIKIVAVAFAVIVGVGILLIQAWDRIGEVIRSRSPSQLPNTYLVRTKVLLGETNNLLSWDYTLSPLYVWHSMASKQQTGIRMNQSYANTVSAWITDLRDQIHGSIGLQPSQLTSLSGAVSAFLRLVEFISDEVKQGVRQPGLTPEEVVAYKREWGTARETFNVWLRDWEKLFRELKQEYALDCAQYLPQVKPLEW
ncbi:MAG TPA: hypothetical protein VMU77_08105 [Acidimicrobiales bacterium]|nr:hypothetical protein [Acidimicrobiales bacterium]